MKIESKDLIATLEDWKEGVSHTGLKAPALLRKVIDEVQRMAINAGIQERIGEPETKQEDKIKIIAGKLNGNATIRHWNVPGNMAVHVGDYAVVENMEGYDLVRVVGITETKKEYTPYFTGHSGGVSRRVVLVLLKDIFNENRSQNDAKL